MVQRPVLPQKFWGEIGSYSGQPPVSLVHVVQEASTQGVILTDSTCLGAFEIISRNWGGKKRPESKRFFFLFFFLIVDKLFFDGVT